MKPEDSFVSGSEGLDFGINLSGLVPGQRIGGGRFVLERFIGRGGMGLVWKARDERLGGVVALKFLPSAIGGDAAALANLRAEAMRCQKLSHPNVIRIHDLHESPGAEIFFSMELVDGPTLSARRVQLPGSVFTWNELAPLAAQLCDALAYAHGEKTIHRDLKPSNLLMDSQGRLKLADFGIARVVTESLSGQTGQAPKSGTLTYMSPQQLVGKTPRVTDDVYSLGATLYELLTSQPPFHSGDIGYQVLNVPAPPLTGRVKELGLVNDVPPFVEQTILACLEKDSARRPQNAREVAVRLGVAESQIAARSVPGRVASRQRRTAALRAAAILGVMLVLVGVWYWAVYLLARNTPNITPAITPTNALAITPTKPVRGQPWTNSLGMEFVRVGGLLMSVWETRVQDFQEFVRETKRELSGPIDPLGPEVSQPKITWNNPGYPQTELHPAVGLKWHDATEFCEWLTKRERDNDRITAPQRYRPPTEDEWQEALGTSAARFPWGDQWPPPALAGNYAGAEVLQYQYWPTNREYSKDFADEFPAAAPVGSFPANDLGLCDLGGNAWEWCESTFATDETDPLNIYQVLCGGGWDRGEVDFLQTSWRMNRKVGHRSVLHGFRCVLEFVPAPAKKKFPPSVLGSERLPRPVLTNSLGMPFASVDLLLVAIWETREQDFETFVVAAGYADAKNHDFAQAANHPVVGVNAAIVLTFCQWLTCMERAAGLIQPTQAYRLPTDGEWERMADLANAKFVWGNDWPPPSNAGNFAGFDSGGGRQQTAPVGTFTANRWGLFDLVGNAAECCASDPAGLGRYSLRGGSWKTLSPDYLQSSCRVDASFRGHRSEEVGFRCVLAPE